VGVSTLEGYGMTETSPVISVTRPEKIIYGTVGRPLDGVILDIADDGGIQVKGEQGMKGYYKMQVETAGHIIKGWTQTGDIGEFDADGNLKITDRKKSLFKTSGGKYVAPTQVEDVIMRLNFIDQAVVVGNGRMFVTALIVPNYDELKVFAKKNNIESDNMDELVKNPELMKAMDREVRKVQAELGAHERVRKFTILPKRMTVESGELTTTLTDK